MVVGNPALVDALRVDGRGCDFDGAGNLLTGRLGLTGGTLGGGGRGEEGLDPGLVNEVEDTSESSGEEEV